MYRYDKPQTRTDDRISITKVIAITITLAALWYAASIILIGLGASY